MCSATATRDNALAVSVALSLDDRRGHLHLIGKTGTGQTTLLRTLIYDDLVARRNFAVLDPLGGLAEAIVEAVPVPRNDEVIYLDPSDLGIRLASAPSIVCPLTCATSWPITR